MSGHVHTWKQVEKSVLVHDFIIEEGIAIRNVVTARDILKQWKCTGCNAVQTYDLERILA